MLKFATFTISMTLKKYNRIISMTNEKLGQLGNVTKKCGYFCHAKRDGS
jgi:hypothetical protein